MPARVRELRGARWRTRARVGEMKTVHTICWLLITTLNAHSVFAYAQRGENVFAAIAASAFVLSMFYLWKTLEAK